MKFLILTNGGHGDVIPFIALAVELKNSEHKVTLGIPFKFESVCHDYGISCIALDFDVDEAVKNDLARSGNDRGRLFCGMRSKLARTQLIARRVAAYHDSIASHYGNIRSDVDIVVHHFPVVCGDEVAERLGAINVPVCLQPFWVPTRSFASAAYPYWLPTLFNRSTYWYGGLYWSLLHAYGSRWRTERLGTRGYRGIRRILRASNRKRTTVLQAFSEHVFPKSPEYPNRVHTTGFWLLPSSSSWEPPTELSEFLASGSAPVFVGFGNSVGMDPAETTRTVQEAIRLAGVRAVVCGAGGGITEQSTRNDICFISEVPFDWLFLRVSAVVHHGGIGTASRALAAGRPQVICPFTAEHEFFAERMASIGVAVHPIPQRVLNSEKLATAIQRSVSDNEIAVCAKRARAEMMRKEGAHEAVRILEGLVEQRSCA